MTYFIFRTFTPNEGRFRSRDLWQIVHHKLFCCFLAGDEFYFLHVIAENHPSSSLMAGLDGLGGVDSALIVDASGESGKEQVSTDSNSGD